MENTTFCKVAFTFGLGALALARAGHQLGGGDAETVVRRIQVETDDCDWVPLSR